MPVQVFHAFFFNLVFSLFLSDLLGELDMCPLYILEWFSHTLCLASLMLLMTSFNEQKFWILKWFHLSS